MKGVRNLVVALFVLLFAWRSDTAFAQSNITFADTNLEIAVRAALGISNGPVTGPDMAGLISLNVRCANITNLVSTGWAWSTNLKCLDVSGNAVRDLSPLAGLFRLTAFNAGNTRVADASPLVGMTNLTDVWLYGDPVTNLWCITNCQQLRTAFLYNCSLKDVAPLAALTHLSYLELRSNPLLTNVPTALAGLTNLSTLFLGGDRIHDITFLQNLTSLVFLGLDDNVITNVSFLANLPGLLGLDLSYNDPVVDGSELGGFTNLTQLYLSGNSISNAAAFGNLMRLTGLTLYANQLSFVSPLAGLTNLVNLGLNQNLVTNPAALSALTHLAALWLGGNAIGNSPGLTNALSALNALRALDFSQDRLDSIGILNGLTNLVAVYAGMNGLTDIHTLTNLPNLVKAGLRRNLLDLSSGSAAAAAVNYLKLHGAQVDVDQTHPQQDSPATFAGASPLLPGVWRASPAAWIIGTNSTASLQLTIANGAPGSQMVAEPPNNSNHNLLPGASISGSNSTWMLTVTASNLTGNATITLTFTEQITDDRQLSTNVTVPVTVMAPMQVSVPDTNLDALISALVQGTPGDLTTLDLLSVTNIVTFDGAVSDLTGLQWATNLTVLSLDAAAISNLTILQSLPQLTYLTIFDYRGSDLSPLSTLTNLTGLYMDDCALTNLSFLTNLTHLRYLSLEENQITDIQPLVALTNIEFLSLWQNHIAVIAPLPSLPRLNVCDVEFNLLNLTPGSAAQIVIQNLLSRGTTVYYQTQRQPPNILAPLGWTVTRGVTSSVYINVWDNGPEDEAMIVVARSSNTNLVTIQSLKKGMDSDWLLTLDPSFTQTGTNTIFINVTNDVGYIADWDFVVTTAPPASVDGTVLNSPGLTWLTGADAPWNAETDMTHDGLSAAESGDIDNGYDTWLQTTLAGPGTLSFWWMLSARTNDAVQFYLNDTLEACMSGATTWVQKVISVPPGTQTALWRYVKDRECCSGGTDAAWLDQVTFVPLSWLELAGRPTNGQCQLILHPVPGVYHQVLCSTNLVDWMMLTLLAPTNSSVSFLDNAANSQARYYRLREVTSSSIWIEKVNLVGNEVRMELHSPPGLRLQVQSSFDLSSWTGLNLVTNTPGILQYTNTLAGTPPPFLFYRALLVP